MLELCEFFKTRKERLWNLNDDSDLEEDPCYQRIRKRSLSGQQSEERPGGVIDAGKEPPVCSTQTRRPRKCYSELAAPSLKDCEARNQYGGRRIGVCQQTEGTQAQARAFPREVMRERRCTQSFSPQRMENLPPTHNSPANGDTAVPRQLSTIDERCEGHVVRNFRTWRYGRQEVLDGENQQRRRIGVCQETDDTREPRTFVRVLHKRF